MDAIFRHKMNGTVAEGWWRKEMQWDEEEVEGEEENAKNSDKNLVTKKIGRRHRG